MESSDCNKQYTPHNVSCSPHHPAEESLFELRRGRVETVNFHKHTQLHNVRCTLHHPAEKSFYELKKCRVKAK